MGACDDLGWRFAGLLESCQVIITLQENCTYIDNYNVDIEFAKK